MENKMRPLVSFYLPAIIGSGLMLFIGWKNNITIAPWIAFPLLLFSFRNAKTWWSTLPAVVVMLIARWVPIHNSWDLDQSMEWLTAVLMNAPLYLGLYLDRNFHASLPSIAGSLIFPVFYTAVEWLLTFSPLGGVLSLAYTQSQFTFLTQTASLTGASGITFMTTWFAPAIIGFLNSVRSGDRQTKSSILLYSCVLIGLLLFGSFKTLLTTPSHGTVKVGSVSVPHIRNYWAITEKGTRREEADRYRSELILLKNDLFTASRRAAEAGAQIIFWAEGNGVMFEDAYEKFIAEAQDFARVHRVYFAPAILVLRFDRYKNDNKIVMINPKGEVSYNYEKTHSFNPTDSDGILNTVSTPFGTVGSVICFDLDFPRFVRQAYTSGTDILIVPGFDTEGISPYHTAGGLLRGIEYGFSTVRHALKSVSMAADYNGTVLGYQSSFNTDDTVMITDIPVQGRRTLYGSIGFDWFNWAVVLIIPVLIAIGIKRKRKSA